MTTVHLLLARMRLMAARAIGYGKPAPGGRFEAITPTVTDPVAWAELTNERRLRNSY
ncbi:hypothetical protein Val02_51870 [Virgisporangium aliadipatigenens]|uniref:Uncharacterized protein n=1 Tax=Virgisporangium aliadipatigenens TaxID=741659 RepID=A0A8J3YN56_9ACTN|nr:hypothetical protein [Virgisporangium aliadipatigenens]GIJ48301.1 hypothetical protein Val02_51870 [Virgisporangium aliadipatigenens]